MNGYDRRSSCAGQRETRPICSFRILVDDPFTPVIDAAPPSVLVTPKLFESLLFADKNLIVMSTSEPSVALSQLRQLAMRGGQAVYVWEPQLGINMPADLVDSVEYLRCNGSSTARLRLRDGKWLR